MTGKKTTVTDNRQEYVVGPSGDGGLQAEDDPLIRVPVAEPGGRAGRG